MREIQHFIDGSAFAGNSGRYGDVYNPNTGEVQARVPFATPDEVAKAVASAQEAQPKWAAMNPQRRARGLMKSKELVEAEIVPVGRRVGHRELPAWGARSRLK